MDWVRTEEFQAKRLLASFDRYRTRDGGTRMSIEQNAQRWLQEVFRPTISRVPQELEGRVEQCSTFP
ncbi:MAG: DUF4032 domain-containing protein [Actinomycetota bacterium]